MNADAQPTSSHEWQSRFLDNLNRLDKSEQARLRRNAGRTLDDARRVLGIFYRALPWEAPRWMHERAFLVATLFPLARHAEHHNIGASLQRIRTEKSGAGLDRRFAALLDADAGQLPFRLRQIVRLIASSDGGLNWNQLLDDLRRWDYHGRPVQRAWAMSYYAAAGAEREAAQDQPGV